MPYEPPPELASLGLSEIAKLVADRKLPRLVEDRLKNFFSIDHYARRPARTQEHTVPAGGQRDTSGGTHERGKRPVAAHAGGDVFLRQFEQPLEDQFLGRADPFSAPEKSVSQEKNKASGPAPRALPETTSVGYRSKLADFPAPVPDHGYLELPAP